MFLCPGCGNTLIRERSAGGSYWACGFCLARAVPVGTLRKCADRKRVNALWESIWHVERPVGRPCPICRRRMYEASMSVPTGSLPLDVCKPCQLVWFDPREYEAVPSLLPETAASSVPASEQAREALARLELKKIDARAERERWKGEPPLEAWKGILASLGLPFEHDESPGLRRPWISWGLVLAFVVWSIASLIDPSISVERFGLIPSDPFRHGGITWLTSFFAHGGGWHLLVNAYFLAVFGDNVEEYLGRFKYPLLLFLAHVAGVAAHVAIEPASTIPVAGASAGISGVLVCYGLAFPRARIGYLLAFRRFSVAHLSDAFYRWLSFPAWFALVVWICIQLYLSFRQFQGLAFVSAAAHLGGGAAGLAFWLLFRKR